MKEEDQNIVRTFVCLDVSDDVTKEVARIQGILCNEKFHGKTTELENLHLTLKFLGEVSLEKANEIKERLRKIKFEKFKAKLSGLGFFMYNGLPKIIWIKIGGKEVFYLQKQIDEAMVEMGFKKEDRFMSHMTIARIKYVKDKKRFTEHVKKISFKKIEWEVKSFYLKKSELREDGPVYTTLEEFKCNNE